MGVTKTTAFTKEQNDLAIMLKALGHPARIAIVEYLLGRNECMCGDIVKELPLAQATVSQHLKELKNAGIIKGTIEGTSVCYCINTEAVKILHFYFDIIQNKALINGETCGSL
jgi:DNA-binding transcriptional ArsR family regulator